MLDDLILGIEDSFNVIEIAIASQFMPKVHTTFFGGCGLDVSPHELRVQTSELFETKSSSSTEKMRQY